jgi:putative transcriptional regulator
MESLRGRLLVAGPPLWGTALGRSVVLVAHHDADGAVGVILNRPSGDTVIEAVPDLAWMVGFHDPVYLGGPVRPEDVVILAEFNSPEQAPNLAFGSVGFLTGSFSLDEARTMVRTRLLAGHAVWGPGELDAQIEKARAWLPEWPNADDVFDSEPHLLWDRVVARMGGEIAFLRSIPFEPILN